MITQFAIHHYGKLWVLGMGLIMLPGLFEMAHGIPPEPTPLMGVATLAGLIANTLSLIGVYHSINRPAGR